MKLNNYTNEIRNIIFYGDDVETTREINPYNSKAFYTSKNIFDEAIEAYDDYFKIVIDSVIECNNNEKHINAKKRKKLIFVVWVANKYGFVYGSLYIPNEKIIMHEVLEDKKDYHGDGCFSVSYNDKIIFNNEIKIICKDSKAFFARGSDPAIDNAAVTLINELIDTETNRRIKYPNLFHNSDRLIDLYNQKKKEGFDYRVFQYRVLDVNYNYVVFYNCVNHYEKTKEYIKLEKLTNEIKKCCDKWDIDNTKKLITSFKLIKIRK